MILEQDHQVVGRFAHCGLAKIAIALHNMVHTAEAYIAAVIGRNNFLGIHTGLDFLDTEVFFVKQSHIIFVEMLDAQRFYCGGLDCIYKFVVETKMLFIAKMIVFDLNDYHVFVRV